MTSKQKEFPGTPLSEGDFKDGKILFRLDEMKADFAWDTGIAISTYLAALKEGDIELSKVAGAALLKIGARKYAAEVAKIVRDAKISPVARKEALLVLSKFRIPSSVELTIEALADETIQIREEARDAAIQLNTDLLAEKSNGF